MLEQLKKEVYEANMELPRRGLITYTWGNVSGIDRESGYFVIKPSGVDYDKLTPEDMVVMDLDGNKIEGNYRPSSDTPTHLELYKKYPEIRRVSAQLDELMEGRQVYVARAGGAEHPALRHHTRGLFLWRDSVCQKPDAGGD